MDSNENLIDEDVVISIQKGDIDLFGVLIERFEKKLTRYARKFISSNEDIEDAVQEVFIKAYTNIQSFDTDKKFSTWIYRIAHNTYVNIIRSKKNEKVSYVDLDEFFPNVSSNETADKDILIQENKEMITLCVKDLKPKYREIITLFYFDDMDYKTMSDIMGVPISTVGVRLRRAKEKLRQLCKENGYE